MVGVELEQSISRNERQLFCDSVRDDNSGSVAKKIRIFLVSAAKLRKKFDTTKQKARKMQKSEDFSLLGWQNLCIYCLMSLKLSTTAGVVTYVATDVFRRRGDLRTHGGVMNDS